MREEEGRAWLGYRMGDLLSELVWLFPQRGGVRQEFRQSFPHWIVCVWGTLGKFCQDSPPLMCGLCEGWGRGKAWMEAWVGALLSLVARYLPRGREARRKYF